MLRRRGVEVCVDTAKSAEFDIENLRLGPSRLNDIERSLRDLPDGLDDEVVSDVRVRRFDDVDVGFTVTRLRGEVVVTILSVRRVRIRPFVGPKIEGIGCRGGNQGRVRGVKVADEMTLKRYNALSDKAQMQYAMEQAAEVIARADAVLGADGHWVEQAAETAPLRGFGEDRSEFD